ncbi:MAG: O-antigen ligase family protein, partial [Actinomycetota bacterium]|nr:O-antigen ligase family protein [Actinomycetota bacterium]
GTFKAFAGLSLVGATVFGLMGNGLYYDALWLPVAAGVLWLLFATVLARGFYGGVSPEGWVMISLLALLVLVKGLSMIWTISETETIKETLRASMYLATFAIVLAADAAVPRLGWALVVPLAVALGLLWETPYRSALLLLLMAAVVGASAFARGSRPGYRQVGPMVDGLGLAVAAVAGYGLLQKAYPDDYEITSIDGYRADSTIGYPNTTAVLLGMGAVLALSRMTALRNPMLRGLYAVLLLGSLVTLYLTLSRGGIGSFVVGLGVLFVLGTNRLQMLANLLLVSLPGAWVWWRIQDLGALLDPDAAAGRKVADGLALRDDLTLALIAAFVLQAAYAYLASRYELTDVARRLLVAAVGIGAALTAAALAVVLITGGVGGAAREIFSNPDQQGNATQRLVSLGIGFRADYWRAGWEAWLENPLTGTGAGTFQYTWLEARTGVQGVKQIHNLYLEQLTETGIFAFLALLAFVAVLLAYIVRAARRCRPEGEDRLLLSGLVAALVVYLVSSVLEWHWYLPAVTLFFFVLAASTVRLAREAGDPPKPAGGLADETTQG